jgi:hypothetical protein
MAIYTQYGRYLKAKMMKEALSSNDTDTYMVFGLGNPEWDVLDSGQEITIASYNTYSLRNPDNVNENQFYDKTAHLFISPVDNYVKHKSILDINNDTIRSADDNNTITPAGYNYFPSYIEKYKYLLPVFPATWQCDSDTMRKIITLNNGTTDTTITQNKYDLYYIVKDNNNYSLYWQGLQSSSNIQIPTNDIEKQYFAEMYLRGTSVHDNHVDSPVGLLGAIRCEVSLVRELGGVENYTGNIHQFYYGDRYWEIADNSSIDVEKDNQNFPTHLFISTLVNPRYLCTDLNIDLNAVPRHIAIYTKKREYDSAYNNGQGRYIPGENYYRVGDTTHPYAFNFGQYYWDSTQSKWRSIINNVEKPSNVKMLNFTLPCTVDGKEFPNEPDAFKFILNDYIHGTPRQNHVADRFGYVVAF